MSDSTPPATLIPDDKMENAALRAGTALRMLRRVETIIAHPLHLTVAEQQMFRQTVRDAAEALLDAEADMMDDVESHP